MNVEVIVNITCNRTKIENKTKQVVRIKSDKNLINQLLSLINHLYKFRTVQFMCACVCVCVCFVRDLGFEWTVSSK